MAAPTPPFWGRRTTRSRGSPAPVMDSSAAGVPSVDASSTTMMRSTIAGMVATTVPMSFSSLYAGTTTMTLRPSNMSGYCIRPMRAASAVAALLLAVAPAAAAELLPEVSVRLRAARYVPARTDFHWQGWIGGGASLARVGGASAYFTADVETIIGNTLRAFEANQANYHLEAGVHQRIGGGAATLFFHHVSRHYVDRPKVQAVDWNLLGGRIAWPARSGPRPVRVTASLARATLASLVGYRWEATAEVDAEPARLGSAALFGRANVRLVSVEESPAMPRGSFADLSAEAGTRWSRDGRSLDLFTSVERRNDVFLEVPGRRDRAL